MRIVWDVIEKEQQRVHIVSPTDNKSASLSFLENYVADNLEQINQSLLTSGAILFRGFEVAEREEFLKVKNVLGGDSHFNYVDGNSPRTKVIKDVYTSTEYPKEFSISLHNELSYSSKWPDKILFYCHVPAGTGGETPITDSRCILNKIDDEVVRKFEDYGVRYTRYLRGAKGFGKSWMETFETQDKTVVEQYCKENNIEFTWESDFLFLSQNGPGVAKHPVTQERVWFNQANQFHPCGLPSDIYAALKMQNAKTKHKFPQYAYYGNGDEIPEQVLKDVTQAHFDAAIKFNWKKGDILLLDNMLMAHGRMPFEGARKIFVSMY